MAASTLTLDGLFRRWLRPAARAEDGPDESSEAPLPETFVRVHVCGNPVEAAWIRAELERTGVRHRFEGGGSDPYGLTFMPQIGFGTVVVPVSELDRAQEVLAAAANLLQDEG